ncbi:putative nuclease HARBI1 [Musca vetustissima]|uniref:putative nuclease HARBI1 n=1 Tax=Musca vetustissima TaxID=27455 RepID=UPI002AB76A3D|nr:putative nuclease HARBI1 [Musca vetustissima]
MGQTVVKKSNAAVRKCKNLQEETLGKLRKIPKTINFWDVISKMPDDVFSSHFRMNTNTFKSLVHMLQPFWPKRDYGRPCLSLTKSVYITLWKLSNQNSFRELSDRFGIGAGTAYRSFKKTIKVILLLKTKVIVFPSTEISQRKTMDQFEASRALPFPFVIGCIDGTHIRISQPIKDSISYYNRKGTYSLVVQTIVDSNMRFIDVFAGYPGRCHDASVWNNSPIRKAIINNEIRILPECHLLGDGAYPLETFLMTPYKDNGYLTREQKRFNYVLSSTRVFVEQAFGILKKKFRILNYIEIQNVALAKQIIMACCVLHNIIIENEKTTEEAVEFVEQSDNGSFCPLAEIQRATASQRDEAKRKRIELTTLISA